MFAIALYDNQAESEDELNFTKDDILEVIEFDYEGLEGWWLCKLNNKTGLAAGNRLKILNIKQPQQQQLKANTSLRDSSISKTSTISTNSVNLNLSKTELMKTPQKLSTSTKSMNFLTKSVENILNDCNNLKISSDDAVDEAEEYEYDVPENNKPLNLTNNSLVKQVTTSYSDNEIIKQPATTTTTVANSIKHSSTVFSPSTSTQSARKSNSPTIDSGISSSSLMSLNELLSTQTSSTSLEPTAIKAPPELPKSKIPSNESNQIEARLNKIVKNLRETCKILFDIQDRSAWREKSNLEKKLIQIKISFFEIKSLLNEYYELILLIRNSYLPKSEYGCKGNYNELCLKLNEFIQKFTSNVNILNTLNWDINILANNNKNRNNLNDELDENMLRLNYLIELIQVINDFNHKYNVFNNNGNSTRYEIPKLVSTTTTTTPTKTKTIQNNSKNNNNNNNNSDDYADADDDSDADIYENDDDEWLKTNEHEQQQQQQQNANTSTNFSDQMLIKFYSKHIDDNFNDIKLIYELLNKNLNGSNLNSYSSNADCLMDLTNKLALSGHKLVFICDTLNRNLTNYLLKSSLNSLSNNLCDCLKLYVIRIKTCYSNNANLNDTKSNLMIIDSLGQVFNCALQLKQLVIQYL